MPRIPTSTYRLQYHAGFRFDDAAAIATYLADLGISHVYSSPYLQAAPGSTHGYDIVDHLHVNEELGGQDAHERFSLKLGACGLGQVLDIVPNHMSLARGNRYWWDVLENGPSSRFATWFDIDWHPVEVKLQNKVLVPILGDQYGRALANKQIKVVRDGNQFQVHYADHAFPVAPRSLAIVLAIAAGFSSSDTLNFLGDSYARLPAPEATNREEAAARHRDKVVLNTMLDRLCAEEPAVCTAIERALEELNSNIEFLDDFLNHQSYRLAYWKTADQELGYRRFFDVNTLVGLRIEREHVFEETHLLIIDWLKRGVLDGVRVDHPDGLRDPMQYFDRLRKRAPDAWIVGEKILAPGELLRETWPIEGTTGYDFLNVCNGLLINPDGLTELTKIYASFTGDPTDFHAIAHEKKVNVAQEGLGSDVNRLASLFVEICEYNRDRRDYTRAEIRRAIREVAACFRVYRTYVVADRNEITDEDRRLIAQAIACAKDRRQDVDGGLFDFMGDVLTLRATGRLEGEFVQRFQQFTSPVMAKGVEDTAFYCFNRLTSLNEVGADPARNGLTPEDFHAYCETMQRTHPASMTTLSTHDTKRSDDVRARLAVLTEMTRRFNSALTRWARINQQFQSTGFHHRSVEYFYYQTLIGAWPITADRAQAYMEKAMREAKLQTSWTNNNKDFEDGMRSFIECTLQHQPFLDDLEQFVARIKEPGRINSLTQTLLKYTAPGVPDLYQGGELWDHSLVDPDNRRPVDYDLRRKLLAELAHLTPAEILARSDDGLPKLLTIHRALQLRKSRPQSFGAEAAYQRLPVSGSKAAHVIAFSRSPDGTPDICTIAPRLIVTLGGSWSDTTVDLPPGAWRNELTGATHPAGRTKIQALLKEFPIALLSRQR